MSLKSHISMVHYWDCISQSKNCLGVRISWILIVQQYGARNGYTWRNICGFPAATLWRTKRSKIVCTLWTVSYMCDILMRKCSVFPILNQFLPRLLTPIHNLEVLNRRLSKTASSQKPDGYSPFTVTVWVGLHSKRIDFNSPTLFDWACIENPCWAATKGVVQSDTWPIIMTITLIVLPKIMHKRASISKKIVLILHGAVICKMVFTKLCSIAALIQATTPDCEFYRITLNTSRNWIKSRAPQQKWKNFNERKQKIAAGEILSAESPLHHNNWNRVICLLMQS